MLNIAILNNRATCGGYSWELGHTRGTHSRVVKSASKDHNWLARWDDETYMQVVRIPRRLRKAAKMARC